MENQKGIINITLVVVIIIIAALMVGVAWWYENNKEEDSSNTSPTTNTNNVNTTSGITNLQNEQDVRDYIKSALTDSTNVFSECKGSSVDEGTTVTALPNDWFRIRCSVPLKKGEMEVKIDNNGKVIDGPTYTIPEYSTQ